MGYRSDVAMVFYGNVSQFPKLKEWVDTNLVPVLVDQGEPMPTEFQIFKDEVKGFKLVWDFVKWYEDYDDIKALEAVWNKFDEDFGSHEQIFGEFIRIGEENDDVEERYTNGAMGLLYVSRKIEMVEA